MRKIFCTIWFLWLLITFFGCQENSNSYEFGIGTSNGLSASSTNLSLLTGSGGRSVISGGTEPYTVMENTNSTVVSAQMLSRELQVSALTVGTSTIKVKDSSSPPKTVTIVVTVSISMTANVPGTLLFTSNRGDFSVNGIAEYGIGLPKSGSGAVALQDFESIVILAYKVNTPTNIDMTTIELVSNTSDYSGSFYYPSSGKRVFVSFYMNGDSNDSLYLEKGYALKSIATATIQSISADSIRGTFSGNGYYVNNGVNNLAQTISITNGAFNVPILHMGTIEEKTVDKNILAMAKKFLRQRQLF